MRSAFRAFVVCVLAALAATLAGPGVTRAGEVAAAKRMVKTFDFDERKIGNFGDMPLRWYRIGSTPPNANPAFLRLPVHDELLQRGGYPAFTTIRFDKSQRVSGEYSLFMGVNGSNVGAFLEDGSIPAVPGSDYAVSVSVRTSSLRYARAKVVAYFIDDRGKRIDSSAAESEPIVSPDQWSNVTLKLTGDFPDAAWIGVELLVLQPTVSRDSSLGKHQIIYEDVRGGAWFDDVTVWQLPHVDIQTQSPLNLLRSPDNPRLKLIVRDLSAQAMVADVTVFDHKGTVVATTRRRVGDGAPNEFEWQPPLGRYGWYLARLDTRENVESTRSIAGAMTAFLWLNAETGASRAGLPRYGLVAEDISDKQLRLIPDLMTAVDVSSLTLSAWDDRTTTGTIEARLAKLEPIIRDAQITGRRLTLSLSPAPTEIVRSLDLDRESPLSLLSRPREDWMPYLGPLLIRHGQRVHDWQIGSTVQPDAFFMPSLPSIINNAWYQLSNLTAQPRLVIPWRADQGRRNDVVEPCVYAIDVPDAILPGHIADQVARFRDEPAAEFRLHLRVARADRMSHDSRMIDLAHRMIYASASGAAEISITKPWTAAADARGVILPDPILGVFSQVAHRLQGRTLVGRLPVNPGVQCLIFKGPTDGLLVAWNDAAEEKDALIDTYLGESPVAFDLFGNSVSIKPTDGRHRIALTAAPRFIEGVDPALALFRASFTLDPPFLESTQTTLRRTIRFTNPWPRTITGSFLVTQPTTWRVEPRRNYFSVGAGQTAEIPVEVSFPISEVSARKQLVARFDFTAEHHMVVDLTTPSEVGLRDIEFDATLSYEASAGGRGRDAIVTQIITNRGGQPLSLYAFANMPGQPRQERLIPTLQRGQQVVRRFRFPIEGVSEKDAAVRVGLREAQGPAVLNKVLALETR